jgi:hypothetical protein
MFKVMLKSSFDRLLADWKQYAIMQERSETQSRKDIVAAALAMDMLYMPVYHQSDDWEDPLVGFVTHVHTDRKGAPLYHVFDWITGETKVTFSVTKWVNMNSWENHINSGILPIMNLTPYERYNFLVCNDYKKNVLVANFDNLEFTNSEQLHHKLSTSGFFDMVEKICIAENPMLLKNILLSAIAEHEDELIARNFVKGQLNEQ